MISGEPWLVNKHASVEVESRLRTKLSRPFDSVRALLAVTNLILWGVAPGFFTEAVHHSVEITIWHVKKMIYVLKDLDVSVQVYHLAVFHKLQLKGIEIQNQ